MQLRVENALFKYTEDCVCRAPKMNRWIISNIKVSKNEDNISLFSNSCVDKYLDKKKNRNKLIVIKFNWKICEHPSFCKILLAPAIKKNNGISKVNLFHAHCRE